MTERRQINEEQDMLAAEFAFGLLDGIDRAQAEALRDGDVGFAVAVRRWEAQAVTEMETIAPVAPPAALWDRIAAATAAADNVLPFDPAARQVKLAKTLAWWRGGALIGGALAAGLALLMVFGNRASVPDGTEVAALETRLATVQVVGSDDQPIATAVFDQASGTMRVKLDVEGAADVVPEFWVIPEGGSPRSLGRTASGDVRLTAEQQRLVFAGGAFAVSMEPADGNTSLTPRGEVLGAAAIQLL